MSINTSSSGRPSFLYVDTADSLRVVEEAVADQLRVALDTEADSLHHYYEKLCLIQLSVNDRHFIIDPLAGVDLQPLFTALAGKKLLIHGADYDLRLLRRTYGFVPARIYDSAIAAQMLGYKAFGLGALIERHFGVVLPKSSQRADWSRRPLTDKMLEYAVNDTLYLSALSELLDAELKDLGRVEWRRQACERLIRDSAKDRSVDHENRWRVQGWKNLQGRQAALLRAIWEWRESEAQKADRPTFKILSNESLIEIAIWADQNASLDIREMPHASRLFHGRRLETLRRTIKQTLHADRDTWPKPLVTKGTRPDPMVLQAVERLRKARNDLAATLQLDPGVLAPNWSLSSIAAAQPISIDELRESGNLLPWQAEAVGETFMEVLRNIGVPRVSMQESLTF